MNKLICWILGISLWVSLGLGSGFLYLKHHNEPLLLNHVFAFTTYGPMVPLLLGVIYLNENLDTNKCMYNCKDK